jgi:RalA-binding protein 1
MPFPQSTPSPAHAHHRQVATSAASSTSSLAIPTTSTPAPSVSKDRPLTSESLLKLHAATADPKAAALEQAINERNTLSAQNAQLWKLIEKQRAGYNQILKELERVRSERDTVKARLGLSSSNASGSSDRRHKSNDVNRPTNRSVSEKNFNENGSSNGDHSNSNSNPQQAMARHYSDDQRMQIFLF